MAKGYRIGANTMRARQIAANVRAIETTIQGSAALLGKQQLEEKLAAATGLKFWAVDSILKKNPRLRKIARERIDALLEARIMQAIHTGQKTVKGIARKAGLKRDIVDSTMKRRRLWRFLPEEMRNASARHRAGQSQGAASKRRKSIEKVVAASFKKPQSQNELARFTGLSVQGLLKMRAREPIVDAIALDLVSRTRRLTEEEKKRIAKGRLAVIRYLAEKRKRDANSARVESDAKREFASE